MSFYNKEIKCFICNEEGHIATNCPKKGNNNNNNGNQGNNRRNNNNSNSNNRQTLNAQQTTTTSEGNQNNNNNNTNTGSNNNGNNNNNNNVQHSNFQMASFNFLQHVITTQTNHHEEVQRIQEISCSNYACNRSNAGNDQNKENLRKWLLLDSQSTIDIFCN